MVFGSRRSLWPGCRVGWAPGLRPPGGSSWVAGTGRTSLASRCGRWQSPAWRPHARCPMASLPVSLRQSPRPYPGDGRHRRGGLGAGSTGGKKSVTNIPGYTFGDEQQEHGGTAPLPGAKLCRMWQRSRRPLSYLPCLTGPAVGLRRTFARRSQAANGWPGQPEGHGRRSRPTSSTAPKWRYRV